MQQNMLTLYLLILIIISMNYVNSTHFQGGTITYKVVNASELNVVIVLTQTYLYDYTAISCSDAMIANQSPKLSFSGAYTESTKYVDCIQYCNQSGGYVGPSVVSYCTDYSVAFSLTVGQRSDTLQIKNGSYFRVAFQNYAWRALTLPADGVINKAWSISCLINLQMRSDGRYNTPPIATVISPIYIPVGIQQAIYIPTIDGDNDQVRCRFSNGTNECANTCPPVSLPNGTTLLSNCTLLITGKAVNDWYAITLQIEDFLDSTSTTPISSVPVQFLINVKSVPSCSTRPLLTSITSSQTSDCVGVQVGQPYTIQLVAESFCGGSITIKDIATLSYPIVLKTPIVRNSTTTWSISLKWTPTASSVGSQIMCAVAIDSNNVQSNQYCMKFTVAQGSIPICPGETTTTTITTITTTTTTITTITTTSTTITTLMTTTVAVTTSTSTTVAIATATTTETTITTMAVTTTTATTAEIITTSTLTTSLSQTTTSVITTTLLSSAYTTTISSTSSVAPSTNSTTTIQSINSTNSSNINQNSENSETSSAPFDAWVAALLSILGIILLALCCCCCWFCCLRIWSLCIRKQKRKRASRNQNLNENDSMNSSMYTNRTHDAFDEDMFTARPASATSITNIDDIYVKNLSTPRATKPLPHYALPLQRTPRVSPLTKKSNILSSNNIFLSK